MKFFASAAAIAAFLITVVSAEGPNPIRAPAGGDVLTAGTDYTIKWDPTTAGTVTLILRKGVSTNLDVLDHIATGVANTGTFVWDIPATLVEGPVCVIFPI